MSRVKADRSRPDPRTDFSAQKKNLVNLADRPPEERRRIAKLGAQARIRKKAEKMQLQKCMRELLDMPTNKPKQKQLLKSFGFKDEQLTNKTLLMVALFQKGLTGDVSAIRETIGMMDKLDMFEQSGELTNNVVINLVPVGSSYVPGEREAEEIKEVENYDPLSDEPEIPGGLDEWDDWEEDTYDPE